MGVDNRLSMFVVQLNALLIYNMRTCIGMQCIDRLTSRLGNFAVFAELLASLKF